MPLEQPKKIELTSLQKRNWEKWQKNILPLRTTITITELLGLLEPLPEWQNTPKNMKQLGKDFIGRILTFFRSIKELTPEKVDDKIRELREEEELKKPAPGVKGVQQETGKRIKEVLEGPEEAKETPRKPEWQKRDEAKIHAGYQSSKARRQTDKSPPPETTGEGRNRRATINRDRIKHDQSKRPKR